MKKNKNKYFLYAYAYDLDEEMPPFSGRVSYEEYDDLEKAKQEIMRTELSRFAGFEIVTIQVKGPKNKLDDPTDNLHSIVINQSLNSNHKLKLQKYFMDRVEDQIQEEKQKKNRNR